MPHKALIIYEFRILFIFIMNFNDSFVTADSPKIRAPSIVVSHVLRHDVKYTLRSMTASVMSNTCVFMCFNCFFLFMINQFIQ